MGFAVREECRVFNFQVVVSQVRGKMHVRGSYADPVVTVGPASEP